MAPKKENSGGKKFQGRLPEEKRVRVNTKKSSKPPAKKQDGRSRGGDDFPPKKFSKTNSGEYGDKKPFRKDFDSRGPRPTGRPPANKNRRFDERSDKPAGSFPEKRAYRGKTNTGDFKASRPGKSDFAGNKENRFKDKPSGNYPEKRGFRGKDNPGDFKTSRPGDKRFSGGKDNRFKDKPTSGRPVGRRNESPRPNNFKGGKKNYDRAADNLSTGKALVEDDVRLNRYIANSGMCSRREADVMIAQGLVTINGQVVETLGVKVQKGDDVRVDGKRINPERPVYILLNKPKGYITSTTDPDNRATVMDLIDLPGKERIYPVGRLDRNTTGVLLLTNDGELAQKLMHPSFEIKKIYKVGIDKKPSKEHLLAWVNGVELEDGFMSFEQVGFVDEEDDTTLGLEVHSGRNRIVRRMFEHFGYEVKSLDRVMLGDFDHLKLGRGKWRFLNEREINYVEKLKRMRGKKRH